jgi:isoleucyl-tRNA synthetase
VLHDYSRYEFHFAVQKLHSFCSEFLSAFYLDILKDRLYTSAATSPARRSAQSALFHSHAGSIAAVCTGLELLQRRKPGSTLRASPTTAFFCTTPMRCRKSTGGKRLTQRWGVIREVRSQVQKELEALRVQGAIGSALAAEVEVRLSGERYEAIASLGNDLRFVFITSAAQVKQVDSAEQERISVTASAQAKCPRCWHYRADIGSDPAHVDIVRPLCVQPLWCRGAAQSCLSC